MNVRSLSLLLLAAAIATASAQPSAPAADDSEAAYTRVITERADKIVETLNLNDPAKAIRVRDLIAGQYRGLRAIHDPRDEAIKAARASAPHDKTATDAAIKKAQDDAKVRLDQLHARYIGNLDSELTQEQVDKVKDGMTYGVLHVTYNAYTRMLPDLTEEQKTQIRNWLIEARELAMDGGTSNEKHAVFGKYKGRINNYLSAAGYDLKKAEQNLWR